MHAIISEADYRKQIGRTAGNAYLFFGEEDYLKGHAVKLTRKELCPDPAFAVFNDITIDAIDYTADALLNAMTPPPMMADGRLILLRGLDFNTMKPTELDALIETLALLREYDCNTVIIHVEAGLIDEGYLPKRPSTVLKKLCEVAIPVRFEASGPARLATWAGKHFAHYGVQAGAEECALLVDVVGRDMYRLASEIQKVAQYVLANGRSAVTGQDIREVAIRVTETDTFALSNAICAGDYRGALEALHALKFERVDPTLIMGEFSATLSNLYATRVLLDAGKSKSEIAATLSLHEYKAGLLIRAVSGVSVARLAAAVALCAHGDQQIKRAGGEYAVIEWLICSLDA